MMSFFTRPFRQQEKHNTQISGDVHRDALIPNEARTLEAPAQKRPLTGGAKFIAGYVLLLTYAALQKWDPSSVTTLHGLRSIGIIATGLAGGILLIRRSKAAKPVFLAWTMLLASGLTITAPGPDGETLWMRAAFSLMGAIVLILVNREVERNVVDAKE